ncbi:MAG: hypothetical protein K0R29_669 [Pseudobdellovibrio sp.]|jgi:hypothetical protein|nr:hypothetical protein [Pseudobdellovibrio sp.]
MAATYSSFMTTRFYSPVFNTALFDGPLRIYFSQTYESAALKIYHILQTEHVEFWNSLKTYNMRSKQHLFLMIYPEAKDLSLVFDKAEPLMQAQEWDEGLAVGIVQTQSDEDLKKQIEFILSSSAAWLNLETAVHAVEV